MPRAPGDGKFDSPLTIRAVLFKYFLSCSASLISETATYPLDVTKTRLQMLRNNPATLQKIGKPGMLKVFYNIVRHEGVLSLWNGVTPAIYRHFVYTGFRMGCYEVLRAEWHNKETEKRFPIWKSMICGLTAGAFAQFVASPTDLVKVQMQMEGLRKMQGLPARFRNTWHAFTSFYRANGFFSLWTGWIPNCQRAALLNMADLATYDRSKRILLGRGMKDNTLTHACSSAMSGFAAATVSTPADVIKTRIMNQLRHSREAVVTEGYQYKGAFDCLRHIIRHEGFWALYKGFLPTYMRMLFEEKMTINTSIPCRLVSFSESCEGRVILAAEVLGVESLSKWYVDVFVIVGGSNISASSESAKCRPVSTSLSSGLPWLRCPNFVWYAVYQRSGILCTDK